MQTSDAELVLAKAQAPAYGAPRTDQTNLGTRNRGWMSQGTHDQKRQRRPPPLSIGLDSAAKAITTTSRRSSLGNRRSAPTSLLISI